jgi:hypothetical protein
MTDDRKKHDPAPSPKSKSAQDPVSQFLHKSPPGEPAHAAPPTAPHSPKSTAPTEELADAPTIPGYQITARLGEGGMGVV